jgi:hypothetical protein
MRPLEKYLEIWYFFLAEWWIASSIKIDHNTLNRSILKKIILSFCRFNAFSGQIISAVTLLTTFADHIWVADERGVGVGSALGKKTLR